MIKVEGKAGISAKIIADSISSVNGKRITTFELEYPRFIHAEFMTHRMVSKNSASSRAIPVNRMIELIREKTATFVHWGKNQAGMQAKEECNYPIITYDDEYNDLWLTREAAWVVARDEAILNAELFNEAGYHKQIVNRLLEPFQMMKIVATATEWDNFFSLRLHPDAQPEITELARCMYEAMQQSVPEKLEPGEWHVPYVKTIKFFNSPRVYCKWHASRFVDGQLEQTWEELTVEEALKVSASCCAQVSFRKQDDSLEKAIAIYDRLVNSQPVHASPFEHQACPMQHDNQLSRNYYMISGDVKQDENWWEEGVSCVGRDGKFWSANFQSWIQHRQLIPNNVCNNYKKEEV